MNDPHEFIRGYDILWKELPSIEKAAGIKEGKYKISTIWKSISSGKKDVDRNKMLLDALFDNNKTPFVVCFSKQRDYLPMWDMYGDKAMGCCLVFVDNETEYKVKESNLLPDVSIRNKLNANEVLYEENETIKCSMVERKVLVRLCKEFNEKVKRLNSDQDIFNLKLHYLSLMAIVICPRIKDKAYSFEEEKRLFQYENNPHKILTKRNSCGDNVPYVEFQIPTEYLQEIILGPLVDYNKIKPTIKLLLRKKGLGDIKVTKSEIPYRN